MASPIIDLKGEVYGSLTVLRENHRKAGVHWLCVCLCGEERVVSSNGLRTGKTSACRSCSARNRKTGLGRRPGTAIDILVGSVFSELTVIAEVPQTSSQRRFLCRCSCGNATELDSYPLRKGVTRSCGHLVIENRNTSKIAHKLELEGATSGFLEYIEDAPDLMRGSRKIRQVKVLCRACQKEKIVIASKFFNEEIKSCGCMKTTLRLQAMPVKRGPFVCTRCHETKPKEAYYYSKGKRTVPCKSCISKKGKLATRLNNSLA